MTAIEWLVETFKLTNVDLSHHKLLIEQAKQMEKEQIIDAYYEGKEYGFKEHGEQYYNETFKNETTTND